MRVALLLSAAIAVSPTLLFGQAKKPAVQKPKGQQAQKQTPTPAPKVIQIPTSTSQHWKTSSLTLADLANKVAVATAGLRNAKADVVIIAQTPDGIGRYIAFKLAVGDLMHYRSDFLVVQNVPLSCSLANDGTKRTVRLDTKVTTFPTTYRLPASRLTGDRLVSLFEVDFPRMVFQGITEGIDTWKSLLSGWSKGVDGYQASVEERRVRLSNHDFLSYRILATRKGAQVKTLGQSTFEVVIDGNRFLPVTIRNVRKDKKGKDWLVQWNAVYHFNQKIVAKDLSIGS